MSEQFELKPCPFCGGEATINTWRDERRRLNPAAIKCWDCEVETPVFDRIKQAVEAWNRRAGEET